MTKEQRQAIIAAVLISIAVLVWIVVIFRRGTLPEKSQPAGFDLRRERIDFFNLAEQLKNNRPQMEWVRDPFQFPQKPTTKKTGITGLDLTGIIYDKELPVAVINDVIVHEGDTIEGAVVKEIESNSVVLEKEGKLYTLELIKGEE